MRVSLDPKNRTMAIYSQTTVEAEILRFWDEQFKIGRVSMNLFCTDDEEAKFAIDKDDRHFSNIKIEFYAMEEGEGYKPVPVQVKESNK